MDTREVLFIGGCRAADFKVLRAIGCGQFGIVFDAVCTRYGAPFPGKHYALKALFPTGKSTTQMLNTLQAECQIASTLDAHPNVVRFLGRFADKPLQEWVVFVPNPERKRLMPTNAVGQPTGKLATMEFVVFDLYTMSLHDVLGAQGHLPSAQQAVSWTLDVARGLLHLMRAGVVHRDIKTDNILVNDTNHAVVADLGIALQLSPSGLRCNFIPSPGALPVLGGNDEHQAPEILNAVLQLRHGNAVMVDYTKQPVFEVGVLLYELTNGMHPVEDYPQACEQPSGEVSYETVAELPEELGAQLQRFGKSMVACNPQLRPELGEVVTALEAWLDANGAPPPQAPMPTAPSAAGSWKVQPTISGRSVAEPLSMPTDSSVTASISQWQASTPVNRAHTGELGVYHQGILRYTCCGEKDGTLLCTGHKLHTQRNFATFFTRMLMIVIPILAVIGIGVGIGAGVYPQPAPSTAQNQDGSSAYDSAEAAFLIIGCVCGGVSGVLLLVRFLMCCKCCKCTKPMCCGAQLSDWSCTPPKYNI